MKRVEVRQTRGLGLAPHPPRSTVRWPRVKCFGGPVGTEWLWRCERCGLGCRGHVGLTKAGLCAGCVIRGVRR